MCEPGPQARTIVGMLTKAKVFFGIKIGIYDLAKISVKYQFLGVLILFFSLTDDLPCLNKD